MLSSPLGCLGGDLSGPLGGSGPEGRIPDSVQGRTSTSLPSPSSILEPPSELPSVPGVRLGNQGNGPERCHRRGSPSSLSGILRPCFCSSQGGSRGGMETYNRSVSPQQIYTTEKVQNGDYSFCSSGSPQKRLHDHPGPEGCLFPSSDASPLIQVPQICLGREDLPVQVSLFWPINSPTGLHSNLRCGELISSPTGNKTSEVSGRLAPASTLISTMHSTKGYTLKALSQAWPPGQPGKIFPISIPSRCLPGNEDRFLSIFGLPKGKEGDKVFYSCKKFLNIPSNHQEARSSSGHYGFPNRSNTRRSDENETPPIRSKTRAISRSPRPSLMETPTGVPFGHQVVAPGKQIAEGHPNRPSPTTSLDGDRCLQSGMGLQDWENPISGPLVSSGKGTPYKYTRDSGHLDGSSSQLTDPQKQGCGPVWGQYHSAGVYQAWRGHSVSRLFPGGEESPPPGRISPDTTQTSVHSGVGECSSRLPLSSQPISSDGVVLASESLPVVVEAMGHPSSGCIRNSLEQETSSLLLPHPGPSGSGDRCIPPVVGGEIPLHVSTHQDPKEGPPEVSLERGDQGDTNCSLLATTSMVPGSSGSVGRGTQTTPSLERAHKSKHRSERIPPRKYYEFTRVEALQHLFRERNISKENARILSSCHRESTIRNYEAKWRVFSHWCSGRGIHPFAPTLPRLIDFFSYLCFNKKISVSAIMGYRAALSPIFKLAGEDFDNSVELDLLFKAFKKSAPRRRIRPPHWDVNVVLSALKKRPFEPMLPSDIKEVTMKTLFLVALATAHRIGELQALSKNVGFGKDGSALVAFSPEFLAKTESLTRPVARDCRFEALSSLTADRDELLLCPVRALKKYLKMTDRPGRADRLFVSPRDFSKPLSKNAISYFLRGVIKAAYENIPPQVMKLSRVNAHEIRAVATSLRFKYNLGQVALIKSAYWRSNSIFCSRYLRDISHSYMDVSALGPLIVAQGVVQPFN